MTSPTRARRPRPTRRVAGALAVVAVAVLAATGPAGALDADPTGPEATSTVPSVPGPADPAPDAGAPRAALEATTTVLAASATSVVVGAPVTVTATVTPTGSAVVAGGTVEFRVGVSSLGTATVGGTGTATRNVSFATTGPQAVTAVFAGTDEAETSTSAPLTVTVTAAPTPPPPPPPDPEPPSGTARGTGTGTGPGGQTLTVTPNEELDPAGTEVEVTGTGYTAAAGFDIAQEGMYVALCVDKGPGVAPSPCVGGVDMSGSSGSSKWVTNNPYDGVPPESVAAVDPDGSFRVTLTLAARDEFVDCLDLPDGERCVVATRMDHRASADRSQDVKVPVCWAGEPACTTDPIPPPDPADPGEQAPFSGYQLDTTPRGTGATVPGGGLAATGPELAPLPWGLALLGGGAALLLGARRLRRATRPAPSIGGTLP